MPDPIRKITLSRSAAQWLAAHPALAADCRAGAPFSSDEMGNALAGAHANDEATFKRRLRRLRQRVLLRTMARDLDGPGTPAERLAEVCLTMTSLAEFTIRTALDW